MRVLERRVVPVRRAGCPSVTLAAAAGVLAKTTLLIQKSVAASFGTGAARTGTSRALINHDDTIGPSERTSPVVSDQSGRHHGTRLADEHAAGEAGEGVEVERVGGVPAGAMVVPR